VAENNRERLLTFDEIWERLRTSSSPDGPGVRSPGFTPDGTTEITVDLGHYPDAWFRDYCAMAGENYDQEFPRPWPCGSLVLGFDRRKAELLGIASASTAARARSPSSSTARWPRSRSSSR
jgi:hypothetical protein